MRNLLQWHYTFERFQLFNSVCPQVWGFSLTVRKDSGRRRRWSTFSNNCSTLQQYGRHTDAEAEAGYNKQLQQSAQELNLTLSEHSAASDLTGIQKRKLRFFLFS